MLTYNTFKRNKEGKLTMEDIEVVKVNYGISITDKSHYNPNTTTFLSNQGQLNVNPIYHFPDGKDNGLNMAVLTNKFLDVTEKDVMYQKLKQKTGEEIDKLVLSIEDLEQSSKDEIDKEKSIESTQE